MPAINPDPTRHQPELDGIRGIAILLVMGKHLIGFLQLFRMGLPFLLVYHAAMPGWAGVDMFLALSGFLITRILLRTKHEPHCLRSFYMRRVLRIMPAYYLALALYFITAHFSHTLQTLMPPPGRYRIAYLFYLQNWPVMWKGGYMVHNILGAFWSLAVEEQFYLIWPALVLLCSEKTLLRVCGALFAIALPLRILLMHYVFGISFGMMELPTSRMDAIVLGAAIAIYMHRHHRPVPLRWIAWSMSISAAVLLAIAVGTRGHELVDTGRYMNTIGVTAFSLLYAGLVALSQHHPPRLQRALSAAWLRSLGRYSYGMYVYHFLVLFLVRRAIVYWTPYHHLHLPFALACLGTVTAFLLTYLVARISYAFFESYFLRMKSRFTAA